MTFLPLKHTYVFQSHGSPLIRPPLVSVGINTNKCLLQLTLHRVSFTSIDQTYLTFKHSLLTFQKGFLGQAFPRCSQKLKQGTQTRRMVNGTLLSGFVVFKSSLIIHSRAATLSVASHFFICSVSEKIATWYMKVSNKGWRINAYKEPDRWQRPHLISITVKWIHVGLDDF